MAKKGTIGGKIVLDGASQYNADLKNIKSNLTELRSEMKVLNAENATAQNTAETLSAKSEILESMYEQLGKRVETYGKFLEEANKAHENAGQAVSTYKDQLEAAKTQLEQMTSSGKASEEEIAAQQKVVSDLAEKLREAEAGYQATGQKVNQYQAAVNNAKAEQVTLGSELEKTNGYLEEAKESADGCAKSIDEFGKEVKEAGDGTEKAQNALDALAKSELFKVVGEQAEKAFQMLLECADAADKFESAMAKVQSIAQTDSASLGTMANSLQTYSVQLGVSANDLAEATYQAISAGVDSTQAVDFAAEATKLAVGGFTDASKAVDVVTTALNAYGLEATEAGHVMDDLINTQNLGKITVDELAQGLGRIIPTAAAFNVDMDNMSAAIAELTNKGVPARQTITYLGAMLSELGDQGSDVSKTLKDETGKTFGELMESGMSLGDVMKILFNSVENDKTAFMGLWGQTTAATAAFNIASDEGEKFNYMLGEMGNRAGAMEQAFGTMADTSEMTGKRLEVAAENLKVSIGEALNPVLDSLQEKGLEALEPINAFVEEHPELVRAVAGAAAAVAGMTTALAAYTAAAALAKLVTGDVTGVLMVLGTAAVMGGILGLASGAEDATSNIQKLTNASKDLAKETDNMNAAFRQNAEDRNAARDAMDQQSGICEKLVQELTSLNGITDQTAETQARQQAIVNQLNSALPGLGLEYDAATNSLNMSTEALEANVEAMMQQAKVMAAREDMQRIADEQYETEKKLAELEQQIADQIGANVEAYEKLNEQKRINAEMDDGNIGGIEQALTEWQNGKDALAELQAQYAETQQTQSALSDEFARTAEYAGMASGAYDDTAESADNLEGKTRTLADMTKEEADAFEKAHDAALRSLQGQGDAFEELANRAELSAGEMAQTVADTTKTLQDQAAGMQEYAELVARAVEVMQENEDSTGFLSSIIDKGPAAANELESFVSAAESTGPALEAFNTAVEAFNDTADLTENIANLRAAFEGGWDEILDASLESINSKVPDMTAAIATGTEEQKALVEAFRDTMTQTATGTMEDTATAVTDNIELVTQAAQQTVGDTITAANTSLGIEGEGGQSTVFYKMGESIDNSLAAGIEAGTSRVTSAIQKMINSAIAAVNVSGAASSIDRKLGEAFGG